MANEEDECDSASLFAVASQSDVNSFLQAQAAKITGLNSSISDVDGDDDDDESSIDDSLLTRFAQVSSSKSSNYQLTKKKSYLSRSCFASISSQKQNISDDLTELKWLTTFKLKEFQDNKTHNDEIQEKSSQLINLNNKDQISKLINELKTYDKNNLNTNSLSFGVLIFLALYSNRDNKQIPWSLTIKQIYEYIQLNIKSIINKRGWKNLLKQTLNTIPCFIKTKHDIPKSRSIWTIDPYYRPLLTKAYLINSTLESNKIMSINLNDEKQSESIVKNFAPKATVKTKALPRLYERLCEEKVDDEADSNQIIKRQERKRRRSTSSSHRPNVKNNNNEKRLSSSSPWITKSNKRNSDNSNTDPKTSTPNKILSHPNVESIKNQRMEISIDDDNDDDDEEYDSSSLTHPIRKSIITTRSQTAARNIRNDFVHRRKSSPPKKRLSLGLSTHRPNTRINRKIIEQDLELLRQAQQPIDLSNRNSSLEETNKIPTEDILDLSVSR